MLGRLLGLPRQFALICVGVCNLFCLTGDVLASINPEDLPFEMAEGLRSKRLRAMI